MKNRLIFTLICFLSANWHLSSLQAQVDFQFVYSGPDTLFVDNNCSALLDWGHPAVLTASCSLPGGGDCEIVSLDIVAISGGYQIGDLLPLNEQLTITYRAQSDTLSAEGFFSFQLLTADTTAPSFNLPSDVTINCDQSPDPSLTGQVTGVTDNCGSIVDTSYTDLLVAGSCIQNYSILRSWQVTDAQGNVSPIGEQRISVQDINIPQFDQLPQDESISCSSASAAESAFQFWLNRNANALASDNCSPSANLTWFAAVPGSFDLSDPLSFPGQSVADLDSARCGQLPVGIYRSETVAFVVVDECGNANAATATFQVEDRSAPVFEFCPPNLSLETEAGSCDALFQLPIPVISDNCATQTQVINRSQTKAIRSAQPGDDQTIVDSIQFQISIPAVPAFVDQAVLLEIRLTNADIEAATEFFHILGEDGSLLGQTNPSTQQCGNSITTVGVSPANFNRWTADGILDIQLAPNVPQGQSASFGINDICPLNGGGGSASIRFVYESRQAEGLQFSFQLDGEPEQRIDPAADTRLLLDQGVHDIQYRLMDCAGNESSCFFSVNVEDKESPRLRCPADLSVALDTAANCLNGAELILALPDSIQDNCALDRYVQVQPANTSDALLTFSYDPNYLEYIADDKQLAFVGTAANATGEEVFLEVRLTGDVEEAEAFYSVFGEDGRLIGTTETGQVHVQSFPGDCLADPPVAASSISTFSIDVATFNSWAGDGVVNFQLESNRNFLVNPPGGDGDGINPACEDFVPGTEDGQTDSLSTLFVQLSYDRLTPSYAVSGATNIDLRPMLPPSIVPEATFQAGNSTVTYIIQDLAGNAAMCSYEVTVVDTIAPRTICQAATIFVNPSGSMDYVLDPTDVDGGSTDNCGIVSHSLSPNVFSCDLIGTTQSVQLTTTDEFGNQSSCEALVRVEAEAPQPDYSIGLCGNDTLYLTANPPAKPTGLDYNYLWTGPKGFLSTLENPIIPNADDSNSGTYTLQITGLSGCEAMATVEVFINSSPNTPVIRTNSSELCENDTLLLSTQSYSGSNIAYNWYSGSFPNGLLLASTSVPLYKNPPPLQSQTYYVVVEIDGCSSDASALASTTVSDVPSSSVLDAVVDICEGASFALGTNSSGAGFTYQWTGPNGFQSSSQFPSLISEAMLADSGQYRVVISNNGCSSDPAVTMVNIRPRPPQPVLFTEGVLCNGDTLELSTNIPDGGFYTWTGPDGTNYLTTESQLSVLNASANSTGNWQVVVNRDGCNSAPSDSVNVFVEQPPLVIATNNGPVCEGDSVRLVANEIPGATYLWNGPAGFSSLGRRVDVPAVQGNYSIRVSSSLGCVSTVATNVQIYNAPQITAISTSGTDCFFQGDTIRLVPTIFPADDGDYNYLWTSDNGFRALDAQPLIRLDSTSNNRQYSLVVTDNNGCISEQDIIQLALQQAPPTPPIDGPEVICSGDVLTLNSRPYAGRDVLYLWQTPLGTDTTSIPSLTISPVDAINSGNYRLQVVVDGCSSPFSSTIPLQVSTSLPAPIAIASGPICEGDTIRLTTDEISGASYEWTGPDGFSFSGPSPVIVNASAANVGSYSVRIDVDGCSSPFSVPVFVDVQSLPTAPILEGVDPVCIDVDNSSVRLSFVNGTAVQGASYIWYDAQTGGQIGGPTFSTSFLLSDFSNYGEGTFDFYVIAELAGCASLPSVPVSVEMNAFPNEEAEAGDDQNFCDVNSTTLNAQSPSVGDGRWRQIQGPAADIVAPDQAVTAVNDLLTNVPYVFEWSLSNGVCLDYSSDQLEVFIGQNEAVAFAGEDVVDCGDGAIQLQADRPASGSGRWTTPDLNLNIIDPSDPGTTVQGLENGSYLFVWTVENGICGSTSDSVEVDYELLPLAFDDDFELDFAPDVFVNVLDDDEVSAPFDIKLGQMPANGAVENLEDGRFRYKPGEGFVQTDEFSYLICSKRCPDQCSEGVVRIRLIRDLACEAPTIFTPNNDRVNDAFVVPCLDSGQYPDSQLSVFNQWGDEVHRAAPYQNDWEGTHQGNPLPVGTYYYILEFGNGEPAVSGFLVLER